MRLKKLGLLLVSQNLRYHTLRVVNLRLHTTQSFYSPSIAVMAATDPSTHVPTSSLFSSLLEQSRKLRQGVDTADLPTIQLGLGEIERRAKELKKIPAGRRTDARARYLLKAGGIDADQNLKDLDSIDFRNAFEQSGPVDTDINVGGILQVRSISIF